MQNVHFIRRTRVIEIKCGFILQVKAAVVIYYDVGRHHHHHTVFALKTHDLKVHSHKAHELTWNFQNIDRETLMTVDLLLNSSTRYSGSLQLYIDDSMDSSVKHSSYQFEFRTWWLKTTWQTNQANAWENLRCISCPDGWRALRFLGVWEEWSRCSSEASWLKADHSFWQSDGVNLWSGSVKQKICVHWSLITAACIRSLSYPDLSVFRPGIGWEKSCVSQIRSDPRMVIQCRLEPLNFHLNSCAPSFRSNMAVPPLRMTVRRSGLPSLLWRKLSLWILMRWRGVQWENRIDWLMNGGGSQLANQSA